MTLRGIGTLLLKQPLYEGYIVFHIDSWPETVNTLCMSEPASLVTHVGCQGDEIQTLKGSL